MLMLKNKFCIFFNEANLCCCHRKYLQGEKRNMRLAFEIDGKNKIVQAKKEKRNVN